MTAADTAVVSISRGRPRSRDADRKILDATISLLIQSGFAGTTMAAIARSAGVSTATLYRRYGNLTEVVIASLAARSERQSVPDTGSLADDLRKFLGALCQHLSNPENTRLLTALLDEAARNPQLAQALYDSVSAPSRVNIATMFERAIARGEINPEVDLELVIDLAVGPIYLRRLENVRPIEHDLADRLTALVLAALTPGVETG